MSDYKFKDQSFQIYEYDKQKTFSSFLPGLAGRRGIPLWAFYVNRGQGICSFGVRDKNGAILEFYPANLAYMYVQTIGFRTFIKVDHHVIECFQSGNENKTRVMKITQSKLVIEEMIEPYNLQVKVTYFGLPNEDIAAITRRVEIKNLSDKDYSIEVLDGIAQILPSGIDYGGYKAISNLLRSWMNVEELSQNFAFYKLRSSTGDEAEMKTALDGNFYVSFVNHVLTRPITDLDLVFAYDTSLQHARHFEESSLSNIQNEPQVTENKVPCGFTPVVTTLNQGQLVSIDTLIGYTKDKEVIHDKLSTLSDPQYFENKELEATEVLDELLHDVYTKTNDPLFDEYIKQNYLDNLLRGGYPMMISTKDKEYVYYLYSRKHGDLERDYNFFTIAPEFYSQGNGNFRDVCQNRRSDVLIHPEVKDYNFYVFGSMIQADGYNPLSINGSTFELNDSQKAKEVVEKVFESSHDELIHHLQGKFTPGSILNLAYQYHINTKYDDATTLSLILEEAKQNIEATFGEGYWVDHWTYILDLIENYEHIYPETMENKLFNENKYGYYLSAVSVYPRSEKYVVDKQNIVHQYGSLRHIDQEMVDAFHMNPNGTNFLTDAQGNQIYTSLYAKLFVLAWNKFACLDPYGIGIEMEANKPGWNDAMNGLPGLFGSGVSETIELKRLVDYLIKQHCNDHSLSFLHDFVSFYQNGSRVTSEDDFTYWNEMSTLREYYREKLRKPTADFDLVNSNEVLNVLFKMQTKLEQSIEKANELGKGIMPTYLIYHATKFDLILDENGNQILSHYGLPKVQVHQFEVEVLPYFLEGPARYLKLEKDLSKTMALISKIKESGLYDTKLKMYKTSDDLDSYGYEIGRIRAFTKGWLERESNFLHMTYKYLLGILKSGHYEAFFEEAKSNLVCELDPEKYGRSTLENSSFIATSNNPNPSIHSQGFVSRLSGSTAEMLSIWTVLLFGKNLYEYHHGELSLQLQPLLLNRYFKDQKIEVLFHGVKVIYHNKTTKHGYETCPTSYQLTFLDGTKKTVVSDLLVGEDALAVRNKEVKEVLITLS